MPDATHPLDILLKKRDGLELSRAEIHTLIHAIVRTGNPDLPKPPAHTPEFISDPQIAAFLMAVFQRGLTPRELADLTQAMRFSGETFHAATLAPADTPTFTPTFTPIFTIDKHSTGGVGDKTSLLIAPILAAAGAAATLDPATPGLPSIYVPMISGRSLGHTGGTLDKLETIPGFRTQLTLPELTATLRQTHAALVGQTPHLVPADRILYALRDHTGTVESPFLITASIMSKKLAEDLRGLVLDVKVGSGAFMPTLAASRHLAQLLVATGEAAGTRTVALLTSMDQPLGRFAGNWLEVQECADILRAGPDGVPQHPLSADLIELSLTLAGHMLHLAGHAPTPAAGATLAHTYLQNGRAFQAWLRIVEAQGGDPTLFTNPQNFQSHHQPRASRTLHAPHAGYLASMDCKQVGWAIQRLGAGRTRPGDPIHPHAGLEVHAKLGTFLHPNQPIFTLHAQDPTLLEEPLHMLQQSLHIQPQPTPIPPLIQETITTGA